MIYLNYNTIRSKSQQKKEKKRKKGIDKREKKVYNIEEGSLKRFKSKKKTK